MTENETEYRRKFLAAAVAGKNFKLFSDDDLPSAIIFGKNLVNPLLYVAPNVALQPQYAKNHENVLIISASIEALLKENKDIAEDVSILSQTDFDFIGPNDGSTPDCSQQLKKISRLNEKTAANLFSIVQNISDICDLAQIHPTSKQRVDQRLKQLSSDIRQIQLGSWKNSSKEISLPHDQDLTRKKNNASRTFRHTDRTFGLGQA